MKDADFALAAQMIRQHAELFLAHCRDLGIPEAEARAALATPQVASTTTVLALSVLTLRLPAAGTA